MAKAKGKGRRREGEKERANRMRKEKEKGKGKWEGKENGKEERREGEGKEKGRIEEKGGTLSSEASRIEKRIGQYTRDAVGRERVALFTVLVNDNVGKRSEQAGFDE